MSAVNQGTHLPRFTSISLKMKEWHSIVDCWEENEETYLQQHVSLPTEGGINIYVTSINQWQVLHLHYANIKMSNSSENYPSTPLVFTTVHFDTEVVSNQYAGKYSAGATLLRLQEKA